MSENGEEVDPQIAIQEQLKKEAYLAAQQEFLALSITKLDPEQEKQNVHKKFREGLSKLAKTADLKYAYVNLEVENQQICSLFDLLQNYPHIRYFNMSNNRVEDISTICKLKYLLALNCSKNIVTDVSFLNSRADFQFIKDLNLSGNKITSVPPIALPNLKKLNLNDNRIETCRDFNGHHTIELLEIRRNKLTSLEGVQNCANLSELYCAENQISNICHLNNLPNLKVLNIRQNNITNLDQLPVLPALKHLNLRKNQIKDLKIFIKLNHFENLKSINVKDNTCFEEGDNKKEVLKLLQKLQRYNKEEVTPEEMEEAIQELKEEIRVAEEARKEEEARIKAEEEAKRLEEEEKRRVEEEEQRKIQEELAEAERQRKQAEDELNKQEDKKNEDDEEGEEEEES